MALTAEGRALTEAHRLRQLATSARAAVVTGRLWAGLDAENIDASQAAWLARNVAALRRYHRESVAQAGAYVSAYRTAELGRDFGAIERPEFNTDAMAQALLLAGPVRVKLLTKGGMSPSTAHSEALRKYTGIVRRQTLSGGRMLIDQTTETDQRAVGWRRVSDGDPCAFCAMLCSRGPVYRSASSAGTENGGLLDNKSGLRFHGHCGCTAEIVYGDWVPSERERGYQRDYERAAQEANAAGFARTETSVLPRLRANGAFRDSPSTRNIPTS
jgi:hypothetical protein